MNTDKSSGIRVLQTVIIIVVIGLLAFVGWRVYENLMSNGSDMTGNEQNNQMTPVEEMATYVSDTIGVSFEYPKTWKKVECPDRPTAVYFGTDDRGVGIENGNSILCGLGTDFPPQMAFALNDQREYQGTASPIDVTIDGIQAQKYREINGEEGLYPKGFEMVTYYIPLEGNKTLIVAYHRWPDEAQYSKNYDTSKESMKKFEGLIENKLTITSQ